MNTKLTAKSPFNLTFVFWFLAILLPWIWLWTRSLNPSFSLIDDPHDLRRFQAMAEDFSGWWNQSGFHGERDAGRLRPIYWLARYFLYFLPAGFNPLGWCVIHYLNLCLVLSCAFYLVKRLSGSNFTAFLGCAIWSLSSNTLSNYTRFGTAEIWQLFWLSMMLVSSFKFFRSTTSLQKWFYGTALSILCFLLYFSKESSVLMLPFAVLMLLGAIVIRSSRIEWAYLLGLNLFLFALQRLLAPPMVGYSTAFQIEATTILVNLDRYFFRLQNHYLILLCCVSSVARVGYKLFKQKLPLRQMRVEKWQFGLVCLATAFFALLLPWKLAEPRYLAVSEYLLALYVALEFFALMSLIPAIKGKTIVRLISGFILLIVIMLSSVFSPPEFIPLLKYRATHAADPSASQSLEWLSAKAEPNSNVLMLFLEEEIIMSGAIYLQEFYQRPDMTIYSFSPYAQQYKDTGYNIVPVGPQNWPGILAKIDYIYWNHRGVLKHNLDQLNRNVLGTVLNSEYKLATTLIYDKMNAEFNATFPEGTQIWKIDHTKLDALRQMILRAKQAENAQ